MYYPTMSDEGKVSIGESNRRRKGETKSKQYKLTCPHCGKEGGAGGMRRFHMNNCKKRVDNVSIL